MKYMNKQNIQVIKDIDISNVLHQVIIGQLLGGANITRRSLTRNSYFRVGFGPNFSVYAYWLCDFFQDLTNKGVTKRLSKNLLRYEFQTKTLPIFNYYHSIFYFQGKKILPKNISELMSPIVLAHLVMSLGHYSIAKNIIEINTYSYTYEDCLALAKAIKNLDSLLYQANAVRVLKERVNKDGIDQYYLAITGPARLRIFRNLVKPYMHVSMLYRLGL